jgi:hypothetical protein
MATALDLPILHPLNSICRDLYNTNNRTANECQALVRVHRRSLKEVLDHGVRNEKRLVSRCT